MKNCSVALAFFVLGLSLILSTGLNKAQAQARLLTQRPSSSSSRMASPSQAFAGMQVDKKNPFKQLDASFRRIPPSTPNPTQNKSYPQPGSEESTMDQVPRSL